MYVYTTPRLTTKIAAGLDIAASLAVEQLGITLKLPFYHPIILGTVGVLTYVLFKWKDEIGHCTLSGMFSLKRGVTSGAAKLGRHIIEGASTVPDILERPALALDAWSESLSCELTKADALKNRNRYSFRDGFSSRPQTAN